MNLTQRPPRSARTRLGGYVLLPRMLDKCRATIAGTPGEYHYDCPLDKHILNFVGIDAEALKAEVAKGLGDGEILEWITANAANKRTPWEIAQWSGIAAAPTAMRRPLLSLRTMWASSRKPARTSPHGPICLISMIMSPMAERHKIQACRRR